MSRDFLVLAVGLLVAGGLVYGTTLTAWVAVDSTAGCDGAGGSVAARLAVGSGNALAPGRVQPSAEAIAIPGTASTWSYDDESQDAGPSSPSGLLAGIPGDGPLTVEQAIAWLDDPANHEPIEPTLPVGLDAMRASLATPPDDPATRAKVELGRQLFFDTRLSIDGAVSCATCHDPTRGFAQPERVSRGVGGRLGARNAPTIVNRVVATEHFWDGRVGSLEEQAAGPLTSPHEMGNSAERVAEVLGVIPAYCVQFERAFPDPEGDEPAISLRNATRAIAAFERTIVTGPSAWDHHERLTRFEAAYGEELDDPELVSYEPELAAEHHALRVASAREPLSRAAERGAELFFSDRAGCVQCHAGANFTDERYHNLGVAEKRWHDLGVVEVGEAAEPDDAAKPDEGRLAVTGDEADRGAFKTPTLRNVAQTAPYLHDGSLATLQEVVAWYVEGGHDHPNQSPLIEPLDLDEAEQADLVAFLEALTGALPEVATDRLPE